MKPCKYGHVERYADGRCAVCKRKRAKIWGQQNKQRRKEICAKYRAANPDQVKNWVIENRKLKNANNTKWRIKNAEKMRVIRSAWQKNNLAKVAGFAAKRRAQQLRATPDWLSEDDYWAMEQAYELAALRTRLFGFAWHVDHVIPLQSKKVSGLHVPWNLQVIPGVENLRKGARL